jgi:acetyl esterase
MTPQPGAPAGQLKQPFRALLGVADVLLRLGINPSPTSMLNKPVSERQQSKPPFWMTRRGDATVATHEQLVPGRGGPVRVRTYVPRELVPGSPAIVYLHGGGFVLGGLNGCDYISRGLASRTGYPVFSVEYRLAPDCAFPGALEDCEDVVRWVAATAPEGVDPTRIGVGGDSAGGNLTAALMLLLRDNDGPAVRHQTLIYPLTDGTCSSASWHQHSGGGIDVDAGAKMMAAYAPDHEPTHPLVSPLHAPDLTGLPPALVITAEFDVLFEDGHEYAARLMEAGVPVTYRTYAGVPHGFVTMPRLTRLSDHALDLMAAEMIAALKPQAAHR